MKNPHHKSLDGITDSIQKILIIAYNMGIDSGTNAADWDIQYAFGGRQTSAKDGYQIAKAIAKALDDGDPSFWNDRQLPNLSGEWAGGYIPQQLFEDCVFYVRLEKDYYEMKKYFEDNLDELCAEWESGVNDGFTWHMETSAKEYIKNYEDNLKELNAERIKRYPDLPEEDREEEDNY